jgi:monoamine oxidase
MSRFASNASMADVLILGAGVAGLTAASRLSAHGLKVTVLEARNRVGGRIHTLLDPADGFPIELGAEFMHGRPPGLLASLADADLRVREIKGKPFFSEARRLKPCGDYWEQIDRVLARLHAPRGRDQSFSTFLRRPSAKHVAAEAREHALAYVEGFNATPAAEVSLKWLARGKTAEEKIDGDRQFRVQHGYSALVHALLREVRARGVEIVLGARAQRVEWARDSVKVQTSRHRRRVTYAATRAIVTLPLGVWQSGDVVFHPSLPRKTAALRKLRPGKVVRVTFRFRERFWLDLASNASRMTFLFSRDPVFPTWWTGHPEDYPLLTGWSANEHARGVLGKPPAMVREAGIEALARLLPVPEKQLRELLVSAHTHDWEGDPFTRGAFSHVLVGGNGASAELARPEQVTLFFAGEATATDGLNGTVNAALDSGHRAAQEILRSVSIKRLAA